MMRREEKNRLFWQQYTGEVRAVDLPMWYKLYDKRIYCANCDCFSYLRDKCVFWRRFQESRIHYATAKREMSDLVKFQKRVGGYSLAAFGFVVEQKGAQCEYYKEVNDDEQSI